MAKDGRHRTLRVNRRTFLKTATAAAAGAAAARAFGGVPAVLAAPGEAISFAMLAGYKEDVVRAKIGEFEQQTGIHVALDTAPYDDLYKKDLLSLSTAARRYDVVFMDEPWVPALSKFLMPLDGLMKDLDVKDFIPTVMDGGKYNGKQYAMPVDPNVHVFIYRKDLFDERHLAAPSTWDDVLKYAQMLHDPSKGMAGFVTSAGGTDTQSGCYMLLFMWSYGGDVLSPTNAVVVDSPAARKGVAMWMQLLKYAPPNVQSYSFADVTKTMQLGKAAMAVQWASGCRPMEDKASSEVAGKLGYSLIPMGTQRTPMRGIWTIGIAQTTQHQDASWKFLQWITGKSFGHAAVMYPATSSAIHSPRYSVLEDPSTLASLPYARALLANLRICKGRSRVPQWPDIQDQLRIESGKITDGAIPIPNALEELKANVTALMK